MRVFSPTTEIQFLILAIWYIFFVPATGSNTSNEALKMHIWAMSSRFIRIFIEQTEIEIKKRLKPSMLKVHKWSNFMMHKAVRCGYDLYTNTIFFLTFHVIKVNVVSLNSRNRNTKYDMYTDMKECCLVKTNINHYITFHGQNMTHLKMANLFRFLRQIYRFDRATINHIILFGLKHSTLPSCQWHLQSHRNKWKSNGIYSRRVFGWRPKPHLYFFSSDFYSFRVGNKT